MKQFKFTLYGFKAIIIILVLFGQSTSVYAKNKECWVDLYDDTQFKGKTVRLQGPTKFANLLHVQGSNWDKKIESLVVGPKAKLIVFENKNFKLTLSEMANHPVLMKSMGITRQDILEDSELIFHPDSRIHGFGEFEFYHKIRSLKLDCVK